MTARSCPSDRFEASKAKTPATEINRHWLGELDGVRALAVLAVIRVHISGGFFADLHAGGLGVAVFFGLSSFLLTYLAVHERERYGTFRVGRFFFRRITRIWPLFFVVLISCYLVFGANGLKPDPMMQPDHFRRFGWMLPLFIGNWGYTLNYMGDFSWWVPAYLGLTWSIAVEEQMYLVFPIFLLSDCDGPAA